MRKSFNRVQNAGAQMRHKANVWMLAVSFDWAPLRVGSLLHRIEPPVLLGPPKGRATMVSEHEA